MRRTARTIGALLALAAVGAACTPSPGPVQQPPRPVETRSPGCGNTTPAPAELVTLPGRRALLAVPAGYDPNQAYPMIVSLHPFVLGPELWEDYSKLAQQGTARGYVVVTPLGSDPGPRWAVPGGFNTGVDDIGYLDALMDDVGNRLCVDRTRTFAAGFSAGAAMAQALGCVLPDRIRAYAASSGANLTDLCPASDPVSGLVMHGTADAWARITGSDVPFATPLGVATDTVVATNAARAGCDPTPVTSQLTPTVEQRRYVGCTSGKSIEYRVMAGAGHNWSGHTSFFDILTGTPDLSYDATATAIDFFDAAP